MLNATHINRQFSLQRNVVLLPEIYHINEPIVIPSGHSLSGSFLPFPSASHTILLAEEGNFPIISCNNFNKISIKNLILKRTNSIGDKCYGIYIKGVGIDINNISIFNASCGIYLETDLADYINSDIMLTDVRFTNEVPDDTFFQRTDLRQFGLLASSVKNLTIKNCHWSHAGLDGIKLRYNCYDIKIIGGSSNKNGLSYISFDKTKCIQPPPLWTVTDNGNAGDGIDCFAGGQKVLIDGTAFEENRGNGITIKSIGQNLKYPDSGNEYCSFIHDYQLRNIITNNNAGSGIAIEGVYNSTAINYRTSTFPDDIKKKCPHLYNTEQDTRARASNILIENCNLNNDHGFGLFLNGIQTTVRNCSIKGTCLSGIQIAENAEGIIIDNCRIISCCKIMNENTNPNYLLQAIVIEEKARGIIISNSLSDGTNPQNAGSPLHQLGVYVTEVIINGRKVSADEVYISNYTSIHNQTFENIPAFIGTDPASGYIYIDHSAPFDNPNGKIAASLNSKFYSTTINKMFIKTTDIKGDRYNGWQQLP